MTPFLAFGNHSVPQEHAFPNPFPLPKAKDQILFLE